MMAKASSHLVNPFPGLRPFRPDEEYLFFGRENQVDTIIDLLAETHFLAVVGTSGSGKSSLVNCGLEPALRRGLMASAGTNWHIARLRPGIDPIQHLAEALSAPDILFGKDGPEPDVRGRLVDTTLRMSKLGIVDIFRQARLPETSHLLVIVDQFEELFRYSRLASSDHKASGDAGEEATAFVNLLLEVRRHLPIPVYIVLTMRSDFLGDCAQFEGLPSAIDIGQFLVPRMTREERRAAITGPVHVAGAEISQVLVTRLVNDVSDNFDQLSVLQHALNRTWAYWQNKCNAESAIDLAHYEAIGTMAQALDAHAERAFGELQPDDQQQICERMFRALTDRATDPRGIRRPTKFQHLCRITNAPADELRKVIEVFRKPSRSFLMPPADEDIEPDSVIDISHESLMRGWKRLRAWADEEANSAEQYRRLVDAARLHEKGLSGPLRDPELQVALDWQNKTSPTEAWARQYGGDLALAGAFLESSTQRRRSRRIQYSALGLLAVVGLAYAAYVQVDNQRKEIALASVNQKQKEFVTEFKQIWKKSRAKAKALRIKALQKTRKDVADEQRDLRQGIGSLMNRCENFNEKLEPRNLRCAIRITNFLRSKYKKSQDLFKIGLIKAITESSQELNTLVYISNIINKNFPEAKTSTHIDIFFALGDEEIVLQEEIYNIIDNVKNEMDINLRKPESLVQIITTKYINDILIDSSDGPHSSAWKGYIEPGPQRKLPGGKEASEVIKSEGLEDIKETVLSLGKVPHQRDRKFVTLRHATVAELNAPSKTEDATIMGYLSNDTRYLALELPGRNSRVEETGQEIKKILLLTLEPSSDEANTGDYSRGNIDKPAGTAQYYETELVILRVPKYTQLSGFHPDGASLAIRSPEGETRYLPWRSEQILQTMLDNWPGRQN